jgi:thymidylate kinase
MIVIIEGADLVGKTTLAGLLATTHGWPIAKIRWALRGDPEVETRAMATATIELLRTTRPAVIFDRIYFSWWAYGPVLGHNVAYMPELIAEFAAVPDACLILLTAAPEAIERRYAAQPDLYFSLEIIQAANERFPSLLPLLPASLPVLHLDTTALAPGELVAEVEDFLASEGLVGRG